MKAQYVRELAEGDRVDAVFALRARDLRRTRTGDAFLSMEFGDRSGSIPGVMFRPSSADEAVPAASVVRVRGMVTTYRGVRRISVESMLAVADYDPSDLLPSGIRDREELVDEMRVLVRAVGHRGLRSLLGVVFGDRRFLDRFTTCPASGGDHHAYVGGLLEHTVGVATICGGLAKLYATADADLLVAAALLHDIGRVDELSYRTSVDRTEPGRMLGHVVLGDRALADAVARLGDALPRDVGLHLSHIVLSHHGDGRDTSPVAPRTIEALLLQHADSTDVTAAAFTEAVSGAALLEESWTDRANSFGRRLRVPRLADGPHACGPVAPCSTIDAVPSDGAVRKARQKVRSNDGASSG